MSHDQTPSQGDGQKDASRRKSSKVTLHLSIEIQEGLTGIRQSDMVVPVTKNYSHTFQNQTTNNPELSTLLPLLQNQSQAQS